MIVRDFYNVIHHLAPFNTGAGRGGADGYDNIGLLVGDFNEKVSKVLLTLDVTKAVVEEAIEIGANLIIAHHPVIYSPLKQVEKNSVIGKLIRHEINVIVAHTNFDVAEYSTSDIMAELLDFKVSSVLNVIHHHLGKGYGRVCDLPIGISPMALAQHAKKAFDCQQLRVSAGNQDITRVALCSGGSGGELSNAMKAGCQAMIGGDIKHDVWIDALNNGFTLIDAGHFPTENIFCNYILTILAQKFHDYDIRVAKNSVEPFVFI